MSFACLKRLVEEGDTVILYIGLSQIYAIEVKPSVRNKHGILVEYTFQTKYGALRVMDLVGKEFGAKVQLTKGYAYVLYPTPELWTLTLPHRTQILYTPDISLIIMELDIRPGSVVCEAGTGSGSLSHAILRAIGPTGHLYTCDFHQERVEVARREFDLHGHASRVTVETRDVCEDGWGRTDIADAVFLDLPRPWEALPHALLSIGRNGGRICSFSPCVEQVSRSCEVMRNLGLSEINTLECIQREFQFRSMSLPAVEVRKVENPLLHSRKPTTTSQSERKKQKISSDDSVDGAVSVETNEGALREVAADSAEKEDCEHPSSSKSYKMRTAIPLLNMQGHTGFLTFATVSPGLKLRRERTGALEKLHEVPHPSAQSLLSPSQSTQSAEYSLCSYQKETESLK